MNVRRVSALFVFAMLACGISVAHAADDALTRAGLTKSEDIYVLPGEAEVLKEMDAVKAAKAKADKELRDRKRIDTNIAAKRKAIMDAAKEWETLEARLATIQKPDVKNRVIIRMNRLVSDSKQAMIVLKDLDAQAAKLSNSGKIAFVDQSAKLHSKAAEVMLKYQQLAGDPDIKATKARLGPSPAFTAAADQLKKWQGEIESEAIPLREDGGIPHVDVLLNGKHFSMGVDTGAAFICLPHEVAEQLDIVPGEQDPVIPLRLANGDEIKGRMTTLKTVRVGRFTSNDVRCVVLEKGLPNPPLLLGNTFLNRYVVKIDQGVGELRLTELEQPTAPKPAAPAKAASEQSQPEKS